ncbi:hypothetical protein RJ641_013245 [Dillenia turbinata]|uniref:Copia protein n=1 Tax=Dillenia turbinata TaxID=194707 RepID=A0AAN8WD12_9MAGN
MKLYTDSKSAISIVHNPIQHDRMKHVRIDRSFIKSEIDNGTREREREEEKRTIEEEDETDMREMSKVYNGADLGSSNEKLSYSWTIGNNP